MPGITNYAAIQALNAILATGDFEFPSALYLGLYTVSPTASSSGTEVTSGNNYQRIESVFGFSYNAPPVQALGPTTLTTFGAATGSAWGTLVAFGLLDSPGSGGNLWLFGPLSQERTINVGDQISFPVNSLTASLG